MYFTDTPSLNSVAAIMKRPPGQRQRTAEESAGHTAGRHVVQYPFLYVEPTSRERNIPHSTVKRAVMDLEKAGLIRKVPHFWDHGSAASRYLAHKGEVCLNGEPSPGSPWSPLKCPL